jgi:phi LC3 family holin
VEILKKLLTRLKNKKVLLSVISGILLILVQLNVIDVEMSHNVDLVVNTVLSVLIAVGVISDPESHLKK